MNYIKIIDKYSSLKYYQSRMHSVKQPHCFQELMSPKFQQKQPDPLKYQSKQKFESAAYQYPFQLFFPKTDHNRQVIPSHAQLHSQSHHSKNNHHYTSSEPTKLNPHSIQNRLQISNHLNPIQNKIISPLIKNSKNVRPNSQDNKYQYQVHNQAQPNYKGQSHFTQGYNDGKYSNAENVIKKRAESQKKNYIEQETQIGNSDRVDKKQKSTFLNLNRKTNINIDQLNLNENSTSKSPYKPSFHNNYNKNYQDHSPNLTKSNCHSVQKILFTPSQSLPQSPLASLNRSPQFVMTYPNSQTSSLSSLKQPTSLEKNSSTRKKVDKVDPQKKQSHVDKDNKFLQKCLYHIMIQNNCLSKQMVMKQIQLSRLKHKLTNYELKMKKQQSINTSMKNDSSSNMQVINSLNNQDQIIEQQWNTVHYSGNENYSQDQKAIHQIRSHQNRYWKLNQQNQQNKIIKTEREKNESLQRIQQSEERERSEFNIEYSVSKQIKEVKQEEEESYYKSHNNIQASPQSQPNKKQKIKRGQTENHNNEEKSSREVMKSENNVNCQSFYAIEDVQRHRLHTVQNDRQVAINLQQVNKLIEQIQIQEHKLKFKSVISVDSPVSSANFNLFSNSSTNFVKNNSNKDRRKVQTRAKDQIIQENIDLTEKAHKLEGLDVTRLDRLRMRKGVVSRKNQQV